MSGSAHDHLERRLAQALQSYTATIEPAPDAWQTIERRITRRRRVWQWPLVTFASAAVAAAVVAAVVLVAHDSGAPTRHIRTQETPPVPTPAPTGTTVPAASAIRIVVARANGAVELLDDAGQPARTLAIVHAYGRVERVAVDPELTTLWFLADQSTTACGNLYRVDLATRAVHQVGTANDFALSPDASLLATSSIIAVDGPNDCTPQPDAAVVVRDAHTDAVRYWWTPASAEGFGYTPSAYGLEWSPDGARLASGICWEGCAVTVVRVPVDGAGNRGAFDGVRLQFRGHLDGPMWTGDDTIVATGSNGSVENPGPTQVREFDATTGAQVREVRGLNAALQPGATAVEWAPDGYFVIQQGGRLVGVTDGTVTEVMTGVAAFTTVPAGGS